VLGLLFLLLPVAVAYGWYMGQRSVQQQRKQKSNQISRQYVTGLNLLLSNQSDKAVDMFIDLLQVDSDTIETHLALGNLFRQRGEVDRAIRIHQNLIARPSIDIEQRQFALLQLAKDFLAAGLYDRAEGLFVELLDEPEHMEMALKQLLTIYQQTREWGKAISMAERISPKHVPEIRSLIAHFYCELALVAETEGQLSVSYAQLRRALRSDDRCVRARIHWAQLLNHDKKYKSAAKLLEPIIDIDIDFVCDIIPVISDSYVHMERIDLLEDFLRRAMIAGGGTSTAIELASMMVSDHAEQSASALILDELKRRPTLRGFHHLMGYYLKVAEEGHAKQSLQLLRDLVAQQLKSKPHYRCRECGFDTHSIYWHCPSCKSWGSVKPIRGLDGE
jgi:lipopolysaccharide biosynthesis regulator YciM